MILFPAIDLMGGKVVRLMHGAKADAKVYSDNPVATAQQWQDLGAEWIHLIDLDRAFGEGKNNQKMVRAILSKVTIPVQLGGGLRSTEQVEEAIAWGARRVILGTRAVRDREWLKSMVDAHGEAVAVAIDTRKGLVEVSGWVESTEFHATAYAIELVKMGVQRVIVTDIDRDGTMGGLNLGLAETIARDRRLKVIASGGAGSVEQLEKLKLMGDAGLEGLVLGRALYEGQLTLAQARAYLGGS